MMLRRRTLLLLLVAACCPCALADRVKCSTTSCEGFCDTTATTHCSFCECRACNVCPSSKGPHLEPIDESGAPVGRVSPPGHERTAEECADTCSALKGVHCASIKCHACAFCTALKRRVQNAQGADEGEPLALTDCGWMSSLTDSVQTYGQFCSKFTNQGKGPCEVHYISNSESLYRRCVWIDEESVCKAGHGFTCGKPQVAEVAAAPAVVEDTSQPAAASGKGGGGGGGGGGKSNRLDRERRRRVDRRVERRVDVGEDALERRTRGLDGLDGRRGGRVRAREVLRVRMRVALVSEDGGCSPEGVVVSMFQAVCLEGAEDGVPRAVVEVVEECGVFDAEGEGVVRAVDGRARGVPFAAAVVDSRGE